MNKMFTMCSGIVLLGLLCSCGSLNQKVGGPKLSPSAIEFADKMQSSGGSFDLSYGEKYLSTSRYATKSYPIFPVFYWSTLGNFESEHYYGVSSATLFAPVFFVVRDSVYDPSGKRIQSETTFNMALAIGYEDHMTPTSSDFRVGLLWIPGIGPFLGAGPKFFQFLWIPFTDFQ